MTWWPTDALWNKAERHATAKRKELFDSAAYTVIQNPNISVLQAETILRAEHRKDGAAQSTVDALCYSLRRGLVALTPADPTYSATLRRLGELNSKQITDLGARVQRFPKNIAPQWSDDDVRALVKIWGECHAGT